MLTAGDMVAGTLGYRSFPGRAGVDRRVREPEMVVHRSGLRL